MPESNLTFTRHAETRMRQRGVRFTDIEIVQIYGTWIASDGAHFMRSADAKRRINDLKDKIKRLDHMKKLKVMRGSDANREISALKCDIRCFERLRGLKVVAERGVVRTVYWTTHEAQRRMLRRGRERAA